jgi:hypothetical protein
VVEDVLGVVFGFHVHQPVVDAGSVGVADTIGGFVGAEEVDVDAELFGSVAHEVAVEAEDLVSGAGQDVGFDGVELELERRDHTEDLHGRLRSGGSRVKGSLPRRNHILGVHVHGDGPT